MTFELFVPGTPAPSGSKSPFVYKDKKTGKHKASLAPANKRQKPWMQVVATYARMKYRGPLLTGGIILNATFCFHRKKGHYTATGKLSKKGRENPNHTVKPDRDKLLRAVQDAMSGIVYKDDCQIWTGDTKKVYVGLDEPEGVLIEIEDTI